MFAWPFIGGQIATVLFVLIAGKSARRIAPLLAGALGAGLLVALILAIFLALPAFFGTLYFGVGLLGFTPILTSITFQRRMRLMLHLGRDVPPVQWYELLWLGIVVAALLPWGIGMVLLHVKPTLYDALQR